MNKYKITVLILLFFVFSIYPVSADIKFPVNPSFNTSISGWNKTGTSAYNTYNPHTQPGSVSMFGDPATGSIYQYIDLTGVQNIGLWYYSESAPNSINTQNFQIIIDNTIYTTWAHGGNYEWYYKNVSISGYTGLHKVEFKHYSNSGSGAIIDDISFYGIFPNTVTLPNSKGSINFINDPYNSEDLATVSIHNENYNVGGWAIKLDDSNISTIFGHPYFFYHPILVTEVSGGNYNGNYEKLQDMGLNYYDTNQNVQYQYYPLAPTNPPVLQAKLIKRTLVYKGYSGRIQFLIESMGSAFNYNALTTYLKTVAESLDIQPVFHQDELLDVDYAYHDTTETTFNYTKIRDDIIETINTSTLTNQTPFQNITTINETIIQLTNMSQPYNYTNITYMTTILESPNNTTYVVYNTTQLQNVTNTTLIYYVYNTTLLNTTVLNSTIFNMTTINYNVTNYSPNYYYNYTTGENYTFMDGYYNSVDNSLGKFTTALNDTVSVLLSPLSMISDGIIGVAEIFNSNKPSFSFAGIFVSMFFNAFPSKVLGLITYILCWKIIFIILDK